MTRRQAKELQEKMRDFVAVYQDGFKQGNVIELDLKNHSISVMDYRTEIEFYLELEDVKYSKFVFMRK